MDLPQYFSLQDKLKQKEDEIAYLQASIADLSKSYLVLSEVCKIRSTHSTARLNTECRRISRKYKVPINVVKDLWYEHIGDYPNDSGKPL